MGMDCNLDGNDTPKLVLILIYSQPTKYDIVFWWRCPNDDTCLHLAPQIFDPCPKKPVITCMNDSRPVALTSKPMKVL